MTPERISTIFVLAACLAFVSMSATEGARRYKVVCYLGSWANYRHGDGKFLIEDIDPRLCTHLVYGFAKLEAGNRIAAYDPFLDLKDNWGLGAFERFNALKERNPELKTLLAIGGWNEGSTKYSKMAASPASRSVFVDSCVRMLTQHGFDGLDLDWEYPANRGGVPDDRQNFVQLLKELREAFEPHHLLLTAAVSAGQQTIDSAYDVPALGKYLDLINLMAYDFHGSWDTSIGHNAPLQSRPDESDDWKKLNVDYAVKYWLKKGAPKEKLVLGMALYGRSFTLQDPQNHRPGAPSRGKGMAGRLSGEPGMLGFNEICDLLGTDRSWTVVFDPYFSAPYMHKDRQWIAYDDIESIAIKVDYIKKMDLGGGMVWSLETDDFRGKCEGYPYPLLTTISRGLNGDDEPRPRSTPTPKSSPTPTEKPITSPTPKEKSISSQTTSKPVSVSPKSTSTSVPETKICSGKGYFRDPADCKNFYMCVPRGPSSKMGYYRFDYTCAPDTVFSQKTRACSFPRDVPECDTH